MSVLAEVESVMVMSRAAAARAVASSPSRVRQAVERGGAGEQRRGPAAAQHLDGGVDHRGVGHDPRQQPPAGKRGAVVVQGPLVHGAADVVGQRRARRAARQRRARSRAGSGASDRRPAAPRSRPSGPRAERAGRADRTCGRGYRPRSIAAMSFDADAPLPGAPDPWASSTMPEMRGGPPYAMTEMIAAEPALAERLVRRPDR